MYVHSVLQVKRTRTLIDLEWKLKMKMATSKYEYEQLERRTLMNQISTFLCLHIVKRPTTYVFANAYSI